MPSTNSHNSMSRNAALLCTSLAVAVLLLGTSSFAITANVWAQASPSPQPQTSGDVKSMAKEVENTVISALKAYANAIGAKYIEIDLFNRTNTSPPANNTTGGVPTVVNQTAFTDAKNMITKTQNQLQSLLQTANLQQATKIAKVQGGIESLKSLIESKAPFNLAEDIVQSPIINNLRQIS